ncbi:hypothetical protein EZ428_18510 [Pedobacter frigiditerrae]|uniref:Uncharacterized protein n=1 Tax=Pedobacter frigiditerrae TaxID=2530452 RepID=A0A4R0MPA6_9SPHI|nr:hypothetical protein EZ428_18510 [Pedobacter frigiditerrae]
MIQIFLIRLTYLLKAGLFTMLVMGMTSFCSCKKEKKQVTGTVQPVSVPVVTDNRLQVDVDFSRTHEGVSLKKDLLGTYCPQKWVNAGKIYDQVNVLAPLGVKFHKLNLPNGTNISADGTWNDITDAGQPSQKTIVNNLIAAGVGIHLGMESVPRAMRGDAEKVQRLHGTSFEKVRSYVGGNVDIFYQILNEPELDSSIEWGYYPNFELFWTDFVNAYIGLANKRLTDANLKIGAPGFELDRWLAMFMDRLTNPATNKVQLSDGKMHGINLDFLAYHNYLNWSDNAIAQSSTQTAVDKMNRFYNGTAAYRSLQPNVKLFCTEYSWLKSPYSSVNDLANNSYRHCARTLELTKLALEQLTKTDRFYWAQSMGQSASFGDDFFTLENYDWDSKNYKYRSGFYAFWIYNKMPVNRNMVTYDLAKINSFVASENGRYNVVVWNKTATSQTIKLSFKGLNTASLKYDLYAINSKSFSYGRNNGKLPSITQTGMVAELGEVILEPEATIYVEMSLR